MAYKYTVRKYGTLIYRPNTDLQPVLAQALWRVQNYEKVGPAASNEWQFQDDLRKDRHTLHRGAECTGAIRALLAKDAVSPYDHDDVAIDK